MLENVIIEYDNFLKDGICSNIIFIVDTIIFIVDENEYSNGQN